MVGSHFKNSGCETEPGVVRLNLAFYGSCSGSAAYFLECVLALE